MPFLVAFAVAVLLTPAVAWLGAAVGLVDRPSDALDRTASDAGPPLKIHTRPVSVLGGVALATGAFAGLAIGGSAASAIGSSVRAAGLAVAVAIALGTGLVDDARSLPAWVRALALAMAGLVLATANAVNLVDGQDGLAGGLTAAAALGLGSASALAHRPAGLALAVAGGALGFVAWNRPPARVFLGNGGAYATGVLLAAAAIRVAGAGWRETLAAGACFTVFAVELALTVGRRIGSRAPVTEGDRAHSYDLLADRLHSRTRSTLWFWGFGAMAATTGALLAVAPAGSAMWLVVGFAAVVAAAAAAVLSGKGVAR